MSRRLALATAALAALSALTWVYLAYLRPPQDHLWGDEGTYVGMTASLARDAATLAEYGYGLELVTPVDLFPQTYHIEAVAAFVLG